MDEDMKELLKEMLYFNANFPGSWCEKLLDIKFFLSCSTSHDIYIYQGNQFTSVCGSFLEVFMSRKLTLEKNALNSLKKNNFREYQERIGRLCESLSPSQRKKTLNKGIWETDFRNTTKETDGYLILVNADNPDEVYLRISVESKKIIDEKLEFKFKDYLKQLLHECVNNISKDGAFVEHRFYFAKDLDLKTFIEYLDTFFSSEGYSKQYKTKKYNGIDVIPINGINRKHLAFISCNDMKISKSLNSFYGNTRIKINLPIKFNDSDKFKEYHFYITFINATISGDEVYLLADLFFEDISKFTGEKRYYYPKINRRNIFKADGKIKDWAIEEYKKWHNSQQKKHKFSHFFKKAENYLINKTNSH
ncbi:MAG: hypothetical protein ACFFCS_25500 [Candidatus Hodarchaeota archaeon]